LAGRVAGGYVRRKPEAWAAMNDSHLSEQSLLPEAAVLERLALSNSGFLFDPVSGHSFTLNETGGYILQVLQRTRDLQELRRQLLADYDVDESTLDRDLLEFLGSVRDQLLRP
jgi:hypothetical protein